MAQAKTVTKTNREQKTSNFPEQHGYQPIGKEVENPEDLEGSNPAPAMKVKNRLQPGYEEFYIPDEQQTGNSNVPDQIKNNAKQAAGEVTQGPRRSRAGYVAPTRAAKKALLTYVDEDVHEAFKAVAKLNGKTLEVLLRDVVTAVVEQYQKPGHVQEAVVESVERYQTTLNKAALRLVGGVNPK